jgi:hypothetical protein
LGNFHETVWINGKRFDNVWLSFSRFGLLVREIEFELIPMSYRETCWQADQLLWEPLIPWTIPIEINYS